MMAITATNSINGNPAAGCRILLHENADSAASRGCRWFAIFCDDGGSLRRTCPRAIPRLGGLAGTSPLHDSNRMPVPSV